MLVDRLCYGRVTIPPSPPSKISFKKKVKEIFEEMKEKVKEIPSKVKEISEGIQIYLLNLILMLIKGIVYINPYVVIFLEYFGVLCPLLFFLFFTFFQKEKRKKLQFLTGH